MSRAVRALGRILRLLLIVLVARAVFDLSIFLFGHPATWALGIAALVLLAWNDD